MKVSGGGFGLLVPPVVTGRGDAIQDDISEYSSDGGASNVPPKKKKKPRPRLR